MSELLKPYPSTAFLDARLDGLEPIALSPLGLNVVRGVYLSQYLGQANEDLTQFFAQMSTVELAFWSSGERQQYKSVHGELNNFFENDNGCIQLAARSTVGHSFKNEEHASSIVQQKIHYMRLGWLEVKVWLPTSEDLMSVGQLTEDALIKPADLTSSAEDQALRADFVRLFMEVDKSAIVAGRPPSTFDAEPRESMVRELLVRGRPTGSRGIDYWLKGCKGKKNENLKLPRAMLIDAWEVYHPNEQFAPTAE